ncbi:hypothetical protein IJI72_01510 [Candidatus Saccharibacteria bacterium]|nr:hypothetical protein [Candidatus Saccharibacteria bacterium]
MVAPYQKPSLLSLSFFGAMGGSSESHTNAYFMPDDETLVFVDISLVHVWKARRLLETLQQQLKRVCLCITHAHLDHISGVTRLAYLVRYVCPELRLVIYSEGSVSTAVKDILMMTGGGKMFPENGRGVYEFGNAYATDRPEWLRAVIRTQHAPQLPSGAVGFEFALKEKSGERKVLIYSGDTAVLAPFAEQLRTHDPNEELELYLDVSTVEKKGLHLCWNEALKAELTQLLEEYPKLIIGLMHYDDWLTLKGKTLKMNQSRIVVVEPV